WLSLRTPHPPVPTLFPYTTLFRSLADELLLGAQAPAEGIHEAEVPALQAQHGDVRARSHGQVPQPFLLDLVRGVPGRLLDHVVRSEAHTSELQSRVDLVCRLLLEK